jgi:hypothetical protein
LEKLSPDFFEAAPFWGAEEPAGEVVLEESGDGFRERFEKALVGAGDSLAGALLKDSPDRSSMAMMIRITDSSVVVCDEGDEMFSDA